MIEHPDRRALHNEVHARPPEPMQAPLAISHVVMLADAAAREASRAHLLALLRPPFASAERAHQPFATGCRQLALALGVAHRICHLDIHGRRASGLA